VHTHRDTHTEGLEERGGGRGGEKRGERGGQERRERETQPTPKLTGITNHWSILSLTINGLKSPIKKTHTNRMDTFCYSRIHYSAIYKENISAINIVIISV
jgi:hypothetical protein